MVLHTLERLSEEGELWYDGGTVVRLLIVLGNNIDKQEHVPV